MTKRSKIWLLLLFTVLMVLFVATMVSGKEVLLRPGAKGNLVRTVQNYLHRLSYLKHESTGYYGTLTREAVKSFQLEHGLPGNGITDTETFTALQGALSQKNSFVEYTVLPGETLVDIAAKFNTSIAAIMVKNNLPGNEILVGQKLMIPAVYSGMYTANSRSRTGRVQAVPWSIVNQLWKNGEIARIIDVDTGKSFQVKRLFGYYHADVEPLTKYDTRTFLEINGGHWSWARRAVIIQLHNLYIAASTNGMPHGRRSIYDNNFPGQFCAHFLGSRIHQDSRVDSEHQAMIEKAAAISLPAEADPDLAGKTETTEISSSAVETGLSKGER
jgi:peptidoglycan hydrolase-like protein with peptidoglycan-binding domain